MTQIVQFKQNPPPVGVGVPGGYMKADVVSEGPCAFEDQNAARAALVLQASAALVPAMSFDQMYELTRRMMDAYFGAPQPIRAM